MISGNTVNILPIQSNDNDYISVVNVYPPSPELGRSIAIDISEAFKTRIKNIQTVQLEPRTNA